MKFTKFLLFAGFICTLACSCRSMSGSATHLYISQESSGTGDGSNCGNALPLTFINGAGNWGAGARQIGPGTTIHLCGVFTAGFQIHGSGTLEHVIEFVWEPGARVSVPYGRMINLNGSNGFLRFNGGVPCGPGTACDASEAANQRRYAAGQTGIIEATANGSALAYQNVNTQAFYGCSGCHDIEIRNLIIRNLYVHSSMSDTTNNADSFALVFQCPSNTAQGCAGGTISIHDSSIHDSGNTISLQHFTSSPVTLNIYNIDCYHNNWCVELSGSGSRTLNLHDNHFHDASNWDTTTDAFHHNGIHVFMVNASDSLGINIYNNLSDGNWGNCCTTAFQAFIESYNGTIPDKVNIYNNVAVQYPGNTSPAWNISATNLLFANNTAIGSATSTSGSAIRFGGIGITFENNTFQGFQQFWYSYPGSTFINIDFNQWANPIPTGNTHWQIGKLGGANTFSEWRKLCTCDLHGASPAHLGVNASGVPQARSALIGAGANLTDLQIPALGYDTSAGGERTPVNRPPTGPWDVGAYQLPSSPTQKPLAQTSAPPH